MRRAILPAALVLGLVSWGLVSCESAIVQPDDGAATSAEASSGVSSGASSSSTGSNVGLETITLEIEAFDVQPGTERQVCKHVNLPVDASFDVVRFRSSMKGTSHHLNVYKLLSDPTRPVEPGLSKVHDCSPASEQLSGDAAYIFGAATPERTVEMPAEVSFHLLPQQRLILEQHVINTGGSVIQGGVTFELGKPTDNLSIKHHADVIWFANWGFFIPPNQESSASKRCNVPYDVNVFGLMSHTHQLGSHFAIDRVSNSDRERVYESTDWAHPIYQTYAPPLSLKAGEGFEWTCTWNNTTPKPVGPGKNSTDEMCMTFAYAYPQTGMAGDPIQCN